MRESPKILIGVAGGLRRIVAVAVLAVLVGSGCQSWVERQFGAGSLDNNGALEKDNPDVASETSPRGELESILADGDGWAEAIDRDRRGWADKPRWRNHRLEDVLSQSSPDRKLLLATIDGADNVAAANAAIVLARLGDPAGEKQLAATIRSRRLNLPLRQAAAEAIGSLRSPSVVTTLRELVGQYGDFRLDRKSQYVASLHVELLLGLAKHVPPGSEPRFLEALDSPDAKVRLVAVEVWSKLPPTLHKPARGLPTKGLPDVVADMTGDTDPRVRSEAFLAVANRGHRQAQERLEAGLRDGDIHVRIAAIEAIGRWTDATGRGMLLPLLDDRSSLIRAAAVRSLSALDADDDVLAAAKDKSWRVRAAVAESLALKNAFKKGTGTLAGASPLFQRPRFQRLAVDLLDDPSLEVQKQVIIAAASWPLAAAGPILLAAVESDSPQTRKLAAEQLATVWPPAAHFPFASSKKRRNEVLARLRREFEAQYRASADSLHENDKGPSNTKPERIEQAQLLLTRLANTRPDSPAQRRAIKELLEFGTELNDTLAAVSIDRQQPLPEIVYAEVLPSRDAFFETLNKLGNGNVMARRSTSSKLAGLAAERRPHRLATARLAALIVRETDQLVWQNALRAVAEVDDEAAVRIAYAAVGHNSTEVRRRACEYMGAWPDARHVNVLLPAIADANSSVARAAVVALGRCGSPRDSEALRPLLRTDNASLRLETATALVRLGDPAGAAALRRLAFHEDPQIRRNTARAMGRSGNASFIPTLIAMLDGRAGVRREALASLTLLSGYNPANADGGKRKTSTEVVELWKRWHEKQAGVLR